MTGNEHLVGWTNEALAVAALFDITAAVWIEKKQRPDSLTPEPPSPKSEHDPGSVEALKAFLS